MGKQGMKAKGSESTKRMLAMMMGSQMDALKKSAFAGWWELVLEEKQHDAMRKMQQDMKAKGAESSKRMLGMLMGAQAETLMNASFAGWQEIVYFAKLERLKEQSMKMRSKEDESRRRMLTMLMGSQESLLVKSSFSAWSECIYTARQMRATEQMRRDMKSKGDESTKRMLGMLLNSQAETLLKGAFASWHELTNESRTLRMRQELKSKTDEGSRRMLGMLLGSQAELMQKAMFTAWHEILIGLKQQREIERVKQGMKAKGSESSKRMLAMMMGSQIDALKKSTFAGWWEHLVEVKQERKLEQTKAALKGKAAEQTKRMLHMLVHSQEEGVLKSIFTSWCDLVKEARVFNLAKQREMDQQRNKLELKKQRNEIAQRMLGRILGANRQILLKMAFKTYQEIFYALRLDKIREDNNKMRTKADESQRRMLSMLMGSQGELMVKAAFSVWQEYLAQQTQSHQLDDLKRSMKAKGEEHTKRMLGLLMSSQAETMLKALVASWVELVIDARTAREVEKLALEMKARGQETSKRM